MYKAIDIRDNSEVVILDPKWLRSIDHLRELDHHDYLVCQGCKQPVRVRAGEQRREHFAHKHLENCPFAEESIYLQHARATLYQWLVSKFGEKVTLEKKVEGLELFRPIDCWVEHETLTFAYWIFDKTLKPEKRTTLQNAPKKLGVHMSWVFISEMLRPAQENPEALVLSTTEREFIQTTKYDPETRFGYSAYPAGSLHYLDANYHSLTTFRGLFPIHYPQIFKGIKLSSALDSLKISPQTGSFVHDGEYENLQKQRLQLSVNKPPFHKQEESLDFVNSVYVSNSLLMDEQNFGRDNTQEFIDWSDEEPLLQKTENTYAFSTRTGKCEFCGEITEDWWWFDGKSGMCKCNACLEQGKS